LGIVRSGVLTLGELFGFICFSLETPDILLLVENLHFLGIQGGTASLERRGDVDVFRDKACVHQSDQALLHLVLPDLRRVQVGVESLVAGQGFEALVRVAPHFYLGFVHGVLADRPAFKRKLFLGLAHFIVAFLGVELHFVELVLLEFVVLRQLYFCVFVYAIEAAGGLGAAGLLHRGTQGGVVGVGQALVKLFAGRFLKVVERLDLV